jgi:molecular chaperone DnaJ
MGGFGFQDMDMGGRSSRPRQGNDVQTQLNISFMEAVHGCQKTITVRTRHTCTTCDGSGTKSGAKSSTCNKCGGAGAVRMMKGMFQIETQCPACNGAGKSTPSCGTCHGETTVAETKKVTVTIPAGVDSNTNLRLVNQGDAGFKNGPRGHLWVKLMTEPDKRFRREGTDVHVTVPLSLPAAVLGCTVEVPTLTGSAMLKVPAGTQPKDTSVMRNKGIKHVNRDVHGHEYIHFDIRVPKNLTGRARELMEEFAVEMGLDKDINMSAPKAKETAQGTKTDTNDQSAAGESEPESKKKGGIFGNILKKVKKDQK